MKGLPGGKRVVAVQVVLVILILIAVFSFTGCYFDPNVRVGVEVPDVYTVAPVCCTVYYGGRTYYSYRHWEHGRTHGWHHNYSRGWRHYHH